MDQWIVEIVIGIVVMVISALLARTDKMQQKAMDESKAQFDRDISSLRSAHHERLESLVKLHEQDAERLRQLELQIAMEHYRKADLDPKFDELKHALKDGMRDLGLKFDKLAEALLKHIASEDGKS